MAKVKVWVISQADNCTMSLIEQINDFIKDKDVIDIKMTTICDLKNIAWNSCLIIYKDKAEVEDNG